MYLLEWHVFSLSIMSTEECRTWVVYIPPLTCKSNRTMERMFARPIVLAHVQLSDHLVSRAILHVSHYLSAVAFIEQQSHIDARYIAIFNAVTSYNARSDRANFVRILFQMPLFRQQFTIHLIFFGRSNIW